MKTIDTDTRNMLMGQISVLREMIDMLTVAVTDVTPGGANPLRIGTRIEEIALHTCSIQRLLTTYCE